MWLSLEPKSLFGLLVMLKSSILHHCCRGLFVISKNAVLWVASAILEPSLQNGRQAASEKNTASIAHKLLIDLRLVIKQAMNTFKCMFNCYHTNLNIIVFCSGLTRISLSYYCIIDKNEIFLSMWMPWCDRVTKMTSSRCLIEICLRVELFSGRLDCSQKKIKVVLTSVLRQINGCRWKYLVGCVHEFHQDILKSGFCKTMSHTMRFEWVKDKILTRVKLVSWSVRPV